MKQRPLAIISLTPLGKALAQRLIDCLPPSITHLHRPKPFASSVQQRFTQGEALIFICATGIVMRTLAPVIQHKQFDPPVLVLDELGKFVIPLLSGHEGGANAWANHIAQILQASAVITTAKSYLNPVYILGMGCERHCPVTVLDELRQQSLKKYGWQDMTVTALTSIDIKANETGLCQLAEQLQIPFVYYSANELRTVESRLSIRSDYVFQTVGCYGVAEAAALYHADQYYDDQHNPDQHDADPLKQQTAELIITKQKNAQATLAIARVYPTQGTSCQNFI